MADRLPERDSSRVETSDIAQQIEELRQHAINMRRSYARQWYDNNFFDDGYHFRFISRTTGRIVDLSDRATLYSPRRAIPKASRQIRGMANLILSSDFIPIVYPEKVSQYNYQQEEFKIALEESKLRAKRIGHWIGEEWRVQELDIKLIFMMLLAMKNCVSFIEIWPDHIEEAIKTQVYDAFDIVLLGNYTNIYDCPFIGKEVPKVIKEIKANELFDKKQLEKISADNRYASDEIKEAYLTSKHGRAYASDVSATLIQKEYFIKEYLNEENIERVREQARGRGKTGDKKYAIRHAEEILKRKKGDPVIRQVFSSGRVWLSDVYVSLPDYPFVDLRLEPGPIYHTAQIQRFIPANKALDSIMSRVERFIHTMNVGAYMTRRGEDIQINNLAGGLKLEYETTKPEQLNLASIPAHVFNFISLLNSFIEEQGVTTSALGKVPSGVKAWGAIESLKASEFANLHIPIKQLKKTVRLISEKMLDLAHDYFISPQTIERLEKGEPDYFDIIGQRGLELRQELGQELPENIVPIKRDYKINIEIESGLGYTEEGKKGRMLEVANFFLELAKAGLMNVQGIKVIVQKLVEVFKFGPTAELLESLDQLEQQQQQPPTEMQDQMKVAFLEVISDLQKQKQQVAAPKGGGAGGGI